MSFLPLGRWLVCTAPNLISRTLFQCHHLQAISIYLFPWLFIYKKNRQTWPISTVSIMQITPTSKKADRRRRSGSSRQKKNKKSSFMETLECYYSEGGEMNMSVSRLVFQSNNLQRIQMTEHRSWLELTGSWPIKDHFCLPFPLPTPYSLLSAQWGRFSQR